MRRERFGAIETGGTKTVCLIGSSPDDITARTRITTGEPKETLAQVISFFQEAVEEAGPLDAIGIASFGPVELRRSHQRYGFVTTSPKPGWQDVDVVGPVRDALGVPVGFDTDVNGAALGEGRWGAAAGLDSYVYMTVGTGVGAGAVIDGSVVHGLGHPEMGHLVVGRRPGDAFPGACPYHGDCLEGLAGGAAVAARWGRPAEQLDGDELDRALELEAAYLAAGLRNIVYTIAPQRIVVGGSVAALPGLFPLLRSKLSEELAGYPTLPEHASDDFVAPAALGPLAGPAGALVLAIQAHEGRPSQERPKS
ncbi:ROK family protein [Kitasatospora sp. NPDC058218]|uniref:ROK family protein n=1 Tax=Kitasatospora sp. NPDC058218 TaxID=3346385 RepID=UPI0036D7B2B0